jgi:hypothetical protein
LSYLDTPRIYFRGGFTADVPTNNNLLSAIDTVGKPGQQDPPWSWNPAGKGLFQLLRQRDVTGSTFYGPQDVCQVICAWDESGKLLSKPTDDPIIGASIFDVLARSHEDEDDYGQAKLVDLDPQQRRLTRLVGLEMSVVLKSVDETVLSPRFVGKVAPTHMRDFWMRGYSDLGQPNDPKTGSQAFSAAALFQSVMEVADADWLGDLAKSPLLQQLKAHANGRLSVRMLVTGFRMDTDPVTNGNVGHGRLMGFIGPYVEAEPREFVAARRLVAMGGTPWPFWAAPFQVEEDRKRLTIDLGNSVPWLVDEWSLAPIDTLDAVILGPDDSVLEALTPSFDVKVGTWWATGGMAVLDLTPAQVETLKMSRLGLTMWLGDVRILALAEHRSGKYVDIDTRTMHINPGESVSTDVFARRLGKPLAGEAIPFALHQQRQRDPDAVIDVFTPDQDRLINSIPADVIGPTPIVVQTDAQGHATLTVYVRSGPINLPKERQAIDSQLYFLGDPGGWQTWGAYGGPQGANCVLNALVYNTHSPIANPTWADVSPILERYARIYPGMRKILNIGDERTVTAFAERIQDLLMRPDDNASHMPVTRDISAANLQTVLTYLAKVIADKPAAAKPRPGGN